MSTAAIQNTTDTLTINVTPTKLDQCGTTAFALAVVACFVFFSTKLVDTFSNDIDTGELVIHGLLGVLLMLWGITIAVILPAAFSRSTLVIKGDVLSIERVYPFRFHRSKSFEVGKVSNIRLTHLSLRTSPPVVAFDYEAKTNFFGRGCKEPDVLRMVANISDAVEKHALTSRRT